MASTENHTNDPRGPTPPEWQQKRVAQLQELFPEAFSEGKVDLQKLQAALGEDVETRPERYSFTWAGKRDAMLLLQTPSRATLVPDHAESVQFEDTGNIFIEGENLEVLKLLYKSYFGRVKMIYIDPPYNTGNDFIYPDNYADPLDTYLKLTGQKDGNGRLLTSNPETSGRYHSSWLSMMYPRLFLARQLLSEEGIIFVSIDDHEVHNLRLLMNEIFGEENFVAEMVWEGALKNDSRFVSISHDYIMCYARNKEQVKANDTVWRTRKEGIDAIYAEVAELRSKFDHDYDQMSAALRSWYSQLNKNHPAWQHRHYNTLDQKGVYFPSDISWPGGGGPTYQVLHPTTQKPVTVPARGWVYPNPQRMEQAIAEDRVEFGPDETKVPTLKRYLHETEGQVLPSVSYQDRRAAMQRLRSLFGAEVFDNPKDERIIAKLVEATTSGDDVVCDFFAGSCTTAQSVLELNREDGGNRRFIMVQLPEPTPEGSRARELDFNTIAEIGKERIRRVITKMQMEEKGKLLTERETPEDLGFRVFKLATSNYRSWAGVPESTPQAYGEQIALYADPLVEGWTAENVLYEVAIREGYGLNCGMEHVQGIEGNTVYRVTDADKGQSFHICLDDTLQPATLKTLELTADHLFICRDKALDDEAAANLALQCRLKTI